MNSTELLQQAIPACRASLPTFIACLIAIIVILARAQRLGGATIWAVLGFGLATIMSLAAPVSQIALRLYLVSRGMSLSQSAWMYGLLGAGNSALHGVALLFLVAAICVGRPTGPLPPQIPQYR